MKYLITILILICPTMVFAQSCDTGDTQTIISTGVNCVTPNGSSYTRDNQATQDAKNAAQAAQDAINNKPENKFNKDLFDGQLGQTSLASNPSLLTMVGALDRFIDFKNFQAIANVVASMFQGGDLSQDEVDIFVSTVKNQGVDLTTYNSLLIDNSVNATANSTND
jgi:hypothetical protein